jgi:hypothetical protein
MTVPWSAMGTSTRVEVKILRSSYVLVVGSISHVISNVSLVFLSYKNNTITIIDCSDGIWL